MLQENNPNAACMYVHTSLYTYSDRLWIRTLIGTYEVRSTWFAALCRGDCAVLCFAVLCSRFSYSTTYPYILLLLLLYTNKNWKKAEHFLYWCLLYARGHAGSRQLCLLLSCGMFARESTAKHGTARHSMAQHRTALRYAVDLTNLSLAGVLFS